MASLFWGPSAFDELVEKATSELLPSGSDDIALNLEICDQIRSKAVTPNAAMKSLKARINHKNPNVQLLALNLVDSCVKNGGGLFLAEITSREFVDNLVSILKQPSLNLDVKNKILFYIQNWAVALEGRSSMGYLDNTYKSLQREGFNFPPRDSSFANAAMTETMVAPEWIDSDVCLRCRTTFTFTNRKHHCRNCGQVFDQQCSSKTKTLPHFGINQEVRVCDGCYNVLNRGKLLHSRNTGSSSHHSRNRQSRHRSFSNFDADLQRALELSLQDNKQYMSPSKASEPPLIPRYSRPQAANDEDDPDLRAAIEASLREAEAPRASAPPPITLDYESPYYVSTTRPDYVPDYVPPQKPAFTLPDYDLNPSESDALITFNQTIEDAQNQGGLVGRHSHNVNDLYEKANRVRPKLAMNLDDADRKQHMLMDMNQKITEATKLYDQYLNQQITAPLWKRPEAVPRQSYDSRSEWRPSQPQYESQLSMNGRGEPQTHYPLHQSSQQVQPQLPPSNVHRVDIGAYDPRAQQQRYQVPPEASGPPLVTSSSLHVPSTFSAKSPGISEIPVPSLANSSQESQNRQYFNQQRLSSTSSTSVPQPNLSQTAPNHTQAPSLTHVIPLEFNAQQTMTAPITPAPPQHQHNYSLARPSAIPIFPSVPTDDPRGLYSRESEPQERKESLLIEL